MTTTKVRNRYFKADMPVLGTYYSKGEQRIIYDGLLDVFADHLRKRIKNNYQNIVVVAGGTGSGKSTFAINLAKKIDPRWDLKKNYIYSTTDLKRKLRNKKSNPISLFDEGSVSLNSGNSMKKEDKEMVVLFDTMRSRGWTSIICIPSLASLNKRIREFHVDYLVICPSRAPIRGYSPRGFWQLYHKERSTFSNKAYFDLIATGTYPDLTPQMKGHYNKIKFEHQEELIEKFCNDEEID